jgi:hypothetical protein
MLAAVMMSVVAALCGAEELSPEAQALHQQLLSRVAPAVRTWVLTEAQVVRSDPQCEERRVRVDAQAQFVPQPVVGNDLDALVFLVYVEVLQQLDREISRRQVPVEPAKKMEKKKPSPATNTVVEARARQEQELTERRQKLAGRVDELGRQLWGLSGTLLESIR